MLRRRIHLLVSMTSGSSNAKPMLASHCMPVSDVVSSAAWSRGNSVPNTISPIGTRAISAGLTIGSASPLVRSRRLVRALKTVPSPITTNVIVTDAVARVVLGVSGPDASGTTAPCR